MSFDKYWERLVAMQPELADPSVIIHISPASFRRRLQLAYDMGNLHEEGERIAAEMEAMGNPQPQSNLHPVFQDIFRDLGY
jgi:hypothetical protein